MHSLLFNQTKHDMQANQSMKMDEV